jgi:hypothetical protein
MNYFSSLFIFLFSFYSFSAEPSLVFNYELIRDWTKDSRHPQTPPYVYSSELSGFKINYIAANHTVILKDPLYALIAKTMQDNSPKIVVIEGVPSSLGVNHPDIIKSAEACAEKSTADTFSCGEPLYTALLAKSNNMSFIGGEPDFKEILSQLASFGLSQEDIAFFHVARNLYGMKRAGELNADNVSSAFTSQLEKLKMQDGDLSLIQFKIWYKNVLQKEFSLDSLSNPDYAPFKTGHKLNQIAYAIDEVREKNILKTIEQALKDYKQVMVVYGSGHLYRHQLVLDDAFKER